jgi:putative FmdB family regulatory protein
MVYEYKCMSCGTVVQEDKPMEQRNDCPTECPVCNNPQFEKIITSPPAFLGVKQKGYYNSKVAPKHRVKGYEG